MSIIPKTVIGQVEFCEQHANLWVINYAAIGLTNGQSEAFKTLAENARIAYEAAQSAKLTYRAAVTNQNAAIAAAVGGVGGASDMIRFIKAFAENSGDANTVYAKAQIPPPAIPAPIPAPGKPENFNVALQPDGSVTLSWDSTNSAASGGAFFSVSRKLPGQSAFTVIGGAPGSTTESRRMSFTDSSIPTSAAQTGAQYIVQGRRGTLMGQMSDAITVQFGVDGDGLTVSAGNGASFKMAA